MRFAIALLLVSPSLAQVQGDLPTLKWSIQTCANSQPCNGTIVAPENIALNDTMVACIVSLAGATVSISDTLSNTWTLTSPTATPAPRNTLQVQIAYTKSTSIGADTISLGGTASQHFHIGVFKNLGAVDGSVATTTHAGNGAIGTMTTSQTTTTNNDTLVSCPAPADGNFNQVTPSANTQYVSGEHQANEDSGEQFKSVGVAGVQTFTVNVVDNSNDTYAMQTLAFQPDTIRLADTVLPDGATDGTPYSAQLHCIGGTATQSYSLFSGSLPTGVSLNTTTGSLTGTPTVGGTYPVGFRCSDGTVTSSTQALSILIGGTFSAPFIAKYITLGAGDVNGAFGTILGAHCGSTIIVFARGDDTHGSAGWVQSADGVSNYARDTFSSPVQRIVAPIVGNTPWPLVAYAIGPLRFSGDDTISIVNNQISSSGRGNSIAYEITNAGLFDSGGGTNSQTNTATGSFSSTITTVVPNTLLLVGSETNFSGTGPISMAAPFSADVVDTDVQGSTNYAHALISSPQVVTVTSNFVNGDSLHTEWDQLVIPLRPSLRLSACNDFLGAGERPRRQIW